MRKKRLMLNTASSLMFQITTIICGMILPKLLLNAFGSHVNGLVRSIIQFLQIISFLELGVGAVVQSALYKPLSEKDKSQINKIMTSAEKFFRHIARILGIYIIFFVLMYPNLVAKEFDWLFTVTLILAISISSFGQYYFGVVDRLLLTADQRGYIQYTAQTITLIVNTISSAILIKLGFSIQIVKLMTSIIYMIRPLILRRYVNKHYKIDRHERYDSEPIPQKWNGVAQHVAAVVLDGTDIIVLTLFSTLSNVSIYSVYHLVVAGIKQLFLSMTNGFQSLIGELWARQELDILRKTFGWFEWLIHTGTVVIFGCTAVLIVPFVQVYTKGISDANYIQPLFAIILTLAHAVHCLRLPYSVMILAGGHYKQTQSNYIIAAFLNVVISLLIVQSYGLIGVAIGTLVAMFYQTFWMANYVSKNLVKSPINNFIKQISLDILISLVACLLTVNFRMKDVSYMSWVMLAVKVFVVWLVVSLIVNLVFSRFRVFGLYKKITNRFKMTNIDNF